jgi:hypothetical protein
MNEARLHIKRGKQVQAFLEMALGGILSDGMHKGMLHVDIINNDPPLAEISCAFHHKQSSNNHASVSLRISQASCWVQHKMPCAAHPSLAW